MLHYLPLYLAHERFLKDEFDLELAPAPHGDKAAVDRLMSSVTADRDVDFCVCDPMMVELSKLYSAQTDEWPIAIAQLVQKVPFWAVNHTHPNFKDEEEFTRFRQIFAYPPPNTGYVFGKFVHDQCSKVRGANVSFRAEKNIDADLDFYLTGNGSVVIEADILKIRKYIEATNNKIVFSFPNHNKFKTFCFTALLTRNKFLQKPEGRSKALKLLSALVKAMYLIYNDPQIPKEYARNRFSGKGYSDQIINGALDDLIRDDIFSKSLVINQKAWRTSNYVQRKVNNDFHYQRYSKFVDIRLAKSAHFKHLKEQQDRFAFSMFRNPLDFPIVQPIAQLLFSFLLFFLPAPYVGLNNFLNFVLHLESFTLLHLTSTAILLLVYLFRGWITTTLKIDHATWLITTFTLLLGYAIGEITIITEMVKHLSGQSPL